MSTINVATSQVIPASPEKVYAVYADYNGGHKDVLPPQYFKSMTVKQGGVGAGTVVDVKMEVMGVKQDYTMTITEPEPGRVLAERDDAMGVYTTFTMEPHNGGQHTLVTIQTEAQASPGVRGFMEKLFNPGIMRKIYQEELKLLSDYVQK